MQHDEGRAPSGRAASDSANRVASSARALLVDAGVEHLHLRIVEPGGVVVLERLLPNRGDLRAMLAASGIGDHAGSSPGSRAWITGKLAASARAALGGGRLVPPAAALWLAARGSLRRRSTFGGNGDRSDHERLVLVDLSASGYLIVGVDGEGRLVDDLLVVNPRCGAGSGINLDRVLQKLAVSRDEVDGLLAPYAGEAGRKARDAVVTRADRCGVFASSATVSDKNQGIPLDVALAATLKSEVLKTCRKVPPGFDRAVLSGRVFLWRFAREVAEDLLRSQGVREIAYDAGNEHVLDALQGLAERRSVAPDDHASRSSGANLVHEAAPREHPGFRDLRRRLEEAGSYVRLPQEPPVRRAGSDIEARPVLLGLDVGSTMAKAVLADAEGGEVLLRSAHSNAGDTIETVKRVFGDLLDAGVSGLRVRGIGITGSARYQVQQALARIHPGVADRISLLVENYAHARGSIAVARQHVARLRERGVHVNEDFCTLVDIGGEDTKVSVIALREAELFANAMNLKCSAGTGSLMDTLAALFGIPRIEDACAAAYDALRGFSINATCAVFLMENARRLQAEGVPRDQILASATWAVVENMARTLWHQIELPRNAVALLHGQPMLSEPLPLAVTDRLAAHVRGPVWALVPPHPGHRACLGLVKTMGQASPPGEAEMSLHDFVDAQFRKRIVVCRGAACGDAAARCNRTSLKGCGADGSRFAFTLGGCTAVNDLLSRKKGERMPLPHDSYGEIWDFLASHHPRSEDPRRLVIPRSFCVTEWAYLLARTFERLGIPVHVDDVRDSDVLDGQGLFNVDTCAPQIGAVGQSVRLGGQPHGFILMPQIETLPTEGRSLGLTCTTNQGGVAVAKSLAEVSRPDARFHLVNLRIDELTAEAVGDQLAARLGSVFAYYGIAPSTTQLRDAVAAAIDDHVQLRRQAADLAATRAEEALAEGRQVALVVGREYVLNPGVYDSSVRRLLRDKRMTPIPSYVLDVKLDERFGHLYWKNPHVIVTLLDAVARKTLHQRIRHPRLAEVFRRIETAADASGPLLPVVQVSTFCCGPDSVTAHLVAEIMRVRPFLLLQSDAVLKELAHLENRVNTYVKQLDLGLHGRLEIGDGPPIDVQRLGRQALSTPLDRERDVIYIPTLADNRCVTSVLRAAGYACIDSWDENVDLSEIVRSGRRFVGDAVCAPLAASYGDLLRAVEDFRNRHDRGDPSVAGKRRLLYFDNQGDGPCRQGQYAAVHDLLTRGDIQCGSGSCATDSPLPERTAFELLLAREEDGYGFGIDEWTLYRCYQSLIVKGVLNELHMAGGAACRDADEYVRFVDAHRALCQDVYGAFESWTGPGPVPRRFLSAVDGHLGPVGAALKYVAYRLNGRDVTGSLAAFSREWVHERELPQEHLRIALTGEVYMRVAQSEDVLRTLLAILGFRRFSLHVAPVWSYLEYLPEEKVEEARQAREVAGAAGRRADARAAARTERRARTMGSVLRRRIAAPLYRAAGLALPHSPRELLDAARELLPTLRPHGELALYVGEALEELRGGTDIVLSAAPAGCMVTTMGEAMTPRILQAAGRGRIQSLFSADGDVDEETLSVALLKALGPERLCAV